MNQKREPGRGVGDEYLVEDEVLCRGIAKIQGFLASTRHAPCHDTPKNDAVTYQRHRYLSTRLKQRMLPTPFLIITGVVSLKRRKSPVLKRLRTAVGEG
eukprot:2677644-Rhodomonas_salina.4